MKADKKLPEKQVEQSDSPTREKYAFIKYDMLYGTAYADGEYNEQEKLNSLLDEFVRKYKPVSYRIVNAQVVFMDKVDHGFGNYMDAMVRHVVHVAYV